MDFVLAGFAAVSAGLFTNPLEVVKTRMQMQGELQKKGQYAIHYRNIVHAAYQIAKHDGIKGLQKGLAPALWIQLILNGCRLGFYDYSTSLGLVKDKNGHTIFTRSIIFSGIGGVIGHLAANPLFIVRTQMQSKSAEVISVGHQHNHQSTAGALKEIFNKHGLVGLYRGSSAAIPRAFVASTAQLTSFTFTKESLNEYEYYRAHPILTSFLSSMIGGIAISVLAAPFDLVMTRVYNQGVDNKGKGLFYTSYMDCVYKIYKSEGIAAFYKGVGPMYMRLGPHSVLCLMFWDYYKYLYQSFKLVI